jgi:ribosomal protein S18 acetylase RimI-like enzyme
MGDALSVGTRLLRRSGLSVKIRAATDHDVEDCVAVLAVLPDFFTSDTHDEVRRDLPNQPAWVATEGTHVVGFLLAVRRFPMSAEITFAAVLPARQTRGIGSMLLGHALGELAASGVRMVEVKTLDASAGYEPYVATRAFWERRGFIQIDCIDPLPGWDPGNPSAEWCRPFHPSAPRSQASITLVSGSTIQKAPSAWRRRPHDVCSLRPSRTRPRRPTRTWSRRPGQRRDTAVW